MTGCAGGDSCLQLVDHTKYYYKSCGLAIRLDTKNKVVVVLVMFMSALNLRRRLQGTSISCKYVPHDCYFW